MHHTDHVVKPTTSRRRRCAPAAARACGWPSTRCRAGEAAGVVSAGNTGALMAIAKFVLRTLPGIDRPAIASFFPTMRGESVMLDLGANVECDADNLVQFAVMGDVFARTVLGVLQPTVGLLNVGSEELKGHEAVREASAMLRDTHAARQLPRLRRGRRHRQGHGRRGRHRRLHRQHRAEDHRGHGQALYASSCAQTFRSSILAQARLSAGAAGAERAARARRSAPLQRRDLPRPQRHRREEPRRHRRVRLRQRDRRRHRHGRSTAPSRRSRRTSPASTTPAAPAACRRPAL